MKEQSMKERRRDRPVVGERYVTSHAERKNVHSSSCQGKSWSLDGF